MIDRIGSMEAITVQINAEAEMRRASSYVAIPVSADVGEDGLCDFRRILYILST